MTDHAPRRDGIRLELSIASMFILLLVSFGLGALVLTYRAPEIVRALSPSPVTAYGAAYNGSATGAPFLPVQVAAVDSQSPNSDTAQRTVHGVLGDNRGSISARPGLLLLPGLPDIAQATSSNGSSLVTLITAGTALQRSYVLTLIAGNTDSVAHFVDLVDGVTGANILPRFPLPIGTSGFIFDGRGDVFSTPGATVQFRIDGSGSPSSVFLGCTLIRTTQ